MAKFVPVYTQTEHINELDGKEEFDPLYRTDKVVNLDLVKSLTKYFHDDEYYVLEDSGPYPPITYSLIRACNIK